MIAFVDIEHSRIVDDPEKGPHQQERRLLTSQRIAEATGLPCRPVHYTLFDAAWARKEGVKVVFISGNGADWWEYDWATFAPLQQVIREGKLPVLGFCGGHQFLAMTFGGECGPMRSLASGEADPYPGYKPGMLKEWGLTSIRIARPDPLFVGLPNPFLSLAFHYWEVKTLPAAFERLAETNACHVQAMRHKDLPICSTQFHPEAYADAPEGDGRRHGAQLLRNFCLAYGLV